MTLSTTAAKLAAPVAARDEVHARLVRLYLSVAPGGRSPRDGERGELDSLAFLEFIELIEREFGIAVDTRDLDDDNFATTAAATAYVRRKLAGSAP